MRSVSAGLVCGLLGRLAISTCFCAPSVSSPPAATAAIGSPTRLTTPPRVDLSHGLILVLADPSSPVAVHAARYLQSELARRLGIMAVVSRASLASPGPEARVIVGTVQNRDLLPADVADLPAPGPDGYVLRVSAERGRALLVGGGGNGVIRGAFALAELAAMHPAGPAWPEAAIDDTPEMPIRMTRDIFAGGRPPSGATREQAARWQLDWWARWGLNYTFLPSQVTRSPDTEKPYANWYVRECHERGMKVGASLGGRSLCPSDPAELAAYLEHARRLLGAGCDFVSVLFDDLPRTRAAGHCERCRQQFGGSMAREQRHILESLQGVLDAAGPDHRLFWCPTYYSLGMTGYLGAAEGPDAYFSILADSPSVRRAWMYHCAFDGTFSVYLDGKGLKHRIWWYNGIRTDYYMVSRNFDGRKTWGEQLTIPGLKDFQSFFSPFENGWLMPGFRSADPSLHPCIAPLVPASRDEAGRVIIPPESWGELRRLANRMDGVYFCGATTPYHVGLTGLFAAHPQRFDSREAGRKVLAALFGGPGGEAARRWEEAYREVQMILARAGGRPLTSHSSQLLQALADRMSAMELQLRERVRVEPLALPPAVLNTLLDDMNAWQHKALACATRPLRD